MVIDERTCYIACFTLWAMKNQKIFKRANMSSSAKVFFHNLLVGAGSLLAGSAATGEQPNDKTSFDAIGEDFRQVGVYLSYGIERVKRESQAEAEGGPEQLEFAGYSGEG